MWKCLVTVGALWAVSGVAFGASAVNLDNEPRSLIVTEGGDRTELSLASGETIDFCQGGCFVTMPNGDRQALTGTEIIEISGGVGRIK